MLLNYIQMCNYCLKDLKFSCTKATCNKLRNTDRIAQDSGTQVSVQQKGIPVVQRWKQDACKMGQ